MVALSLNPQFKRAYPSLFKAIAHFPVEAGNSLAKIAASYLPHPVQRPFWLLGIDVTSLARPSAFKLKDRGFVYQPNPIKGNKPITIGHQYSDVVLLPERPDGNWVVPLSAKRVQSSEDKELVGAEQVRVLLEDEEMPFYNQLCAEVIDAGYSKPAYLLANRDKANLVTIVRVRSNRIFFHIPNPAEKSEKRGHPAWFGKVFSLKDEANRPPPDEKVVLSFTNHKKKTFEVHIEAWRNMLMRGERKPNLLPMQRYPFTLICISQYNEKGEIVYQNPLWLIVIGEKRDKLSLKDIYEAYTKRYDIEHFFRFGKQRLLLDRYQTPDVEHEEKWWNLVHLTYLQLFVSRQYAINLPRPWERYLPSVKEENPSPSMAQRSFDRIIRQFGIRPNFPKHRGNSPGRRQGTVLAPRAKEPVILKRRI